LRSCQSRSREVGVEHRIGVARSTAPAKRPSTSGGPSMAGWKYRTRSPIHLAGGGCMTPADVRGRPEDREPIAAIEYRFEAGHKRDTALLLGLPYTSRRPRRKTSRKGCRRYPNNVRSSVTIMTSAGIPGTSCMSLPSSASCWRSTSTRAR